MIIAWFIASSSALAAERVALVVGNGAYNIPANVLPNPPNDARAISAKLEKLGVEVIMAIDQDYAGMRRSLSQFAQALKGAKAGMFYYAGHGMEFRGGNYLFPVDASLNSEVDVHLNLISVDQILQIMESTVDTRLLFLDACRDNPMARSFSRGSGTRSSAAGRGLASVQASVGTFIAYATAPGEVADDGLGSNSPFTTAMLTHLDEPGLEISQLMRRVRNTVLTMTNDRQVPWESSSLRGDPFVVNQTPVPTTAPAPATPSFEPRDDFAMWMSIETSEDPADYRRFLTRYPQSSLAALASTRLAELEPAQTSSAAAVTPSAPSPVERAADEEITVAAVNRTETVPETVAEPEQAPALAGALPVVIGQSGPFKAGEVLADCAGCPELVVIEPGRFRMGSPADEDGRGADEGPMRFITLREPLAFGRLEVTFDQWDACVSDGGCDGYRPSDEGWGRGDRPVINVSHQDAQSYLRWLSRISGKAYRLPSEAEWEFVARAGSEAPTPWSVSNLDACSFANIHDSSSDVANNLRWRAAQCDDGFATTATTGAFLPNTYGVHDMLGNVWEWTGDCYTDDLSLIATDGSATANGDCRAYALRGGGWRDRLSEIRLASRAKARPSSRTSLDGFRVVRVLDEGLDGGLQVSGD